MVVTREPSAQQLVTRALDKSGYVVICAETADEAIRATLTVRLSAVVLDGAVGSDELDSLTEWIRTRNGDDAIGIVFLMSARTRPATLPIDPERDLLVVRPFSPEQVRSAVERTVKEAGQPGAESLTVGHFELDRRAYQISSSDEAVTLTRREFELLEYMALNEGRCVPVGELGEKIWHRGSDSTGLVRSTMLNLRSKLDGLTNGADLIRTYPRRGYILLPASDGLRGVAEIAKKISIANGNHRQTAIETSDA
ncbi:MAG: response regulator transcription factor [Dehalococcoidia bacterium]